MSARAVAEGRVIVVFGAGGDRDRGKRPLMGEIAARLADLAIVTSDNPRSEDPEAIVDEVLAGARGENVEREVDRRAAIARAVGLARAGDIVVIAGKGHEQGQEFAGGRKEPFDDVTVAREALQAAVQRMRHWSVQRIAGTIGGSLHREQAGGRAAGGPGRTVIDSRGIQPGDLFFGLPGERVDGGAFAITALEAGAWGVVVEPQWVDELLASEFEGAVISSDLPLPALGALARAWRKDLAAFVIAVTGSVGKTTTKDLIAAMITPHRKIAASRANFNTEIGMPLEILAAPFGTEVLVLELAMRGAGQIAELAAICEPDVGVITNIGPVHLEQLGSLEGVAAAKAELLDGMEAGCTGVVPSDEPLLEPWLRDDLEIVTFGPGGDVYFEGSSLKGGVIPDAPPTHHVVIAGGERIELDLPFDQEHNMLNALAAVAAARAIGVTPSGAIDVHFSAMRGERVALGIGALVINDCYNANPLSMRAALDDLASQHAEGRRVAVLGDMLELGPAEREHHREIGAYAASAGVDLLVTVGPRATAMLDEFDGDSHAVLNAGEAAALLPELVLPGDVVLVKGSRGVGLEVVTEALQAAG